MSEINWNEDEWFRDYYAHELTDEFKAWWEGHYGTPEKYEDRAEYFVRCAFAWQGWKARQERRD